MKMAAKQSLPEMIREMTLKSRILGHAAALLVAATIAVPALADAPAGGAAHMEKAALDLIALAKADASTPPRFSDPKAKADFDALLDRKAIIGAPPYAAADLPLLQSAFGGYFALTKMYMNFRDPASARCSRAH